MTKAVVRPLETGDRDEWTKLFQSYLDFYKSPGLAGEVWETTWARLLDSDDQPSGFVAVGEAKDGERVLIGLTHYTFHRSTWAVSPYCYLEDLFVDPNVRGTGAGRALIEAVYEVADEKQAARVYWATQHYNATARKLYDRIATLSDFIQYRR